MSQKSATEDTRKGRSDSLAEAQRRSVPGTRSKVLSPPRMFDQLAPSQEQTPKRLPVLERRNAYTPQQDPLVTQRYDAVAPCGRTSSSPERPQRQEEPPVTTPHEAGGFGRACSSPVETAWRRQGEPPVFFSRLPTVPAWFPSPQEEVKVMQQSAREAWIQLGRRFRAAHPNAPAARTSRPKRKPSRRSSVQDAPSHVPSRTREPARRSSVASGTRSAASPERERRGRAPGTW